MTELEIREVILRAKDGDKVAFGQIYNEYFTPIYRYIYFRVFDKAMADDLVQDVFLKVFNNLHNINTEVGNTFVSYLYTVAKNILIDYFRRKKIPTMNEEDSENMLIDNNTPEEDMFRAENVKLLRSAIDKIPENEAEVITLKFIGGYENKEISILMNRSEDSVRQLQSRGLKSLRTVLKQEDFN